MSTNKFSYNSPGAVKRMSDTTQGNWQWEPQRTNNFEVQLDIASVIKNAQAKYIKKIDMGNLQKNLMLSVANFDAPSAEVSTIKVPYGNNSAKFAGVPDFPDSAITFNDFIGLDVENILFAWHSLVYDPDTELVGQAKNYKTTGSLVEYSPDGELYRQWKIHGLWLSQFKLGSYAQDNNSVRQISGTLIYDYIVPGESNR